MNRHRNIGRRVFGLADIGRIVKDHAVKSDMVRVLKKKAKNSISINILKEHLSWEKEHEVDARDFVGWCEFDDEAYGKAVARKEARIQLLEELIRMKERD
ncbi:hypothetical protein PQE68_gp060 [Bacillus phage vB_BanS_Sophrita]|uniref:Uncharacterized protein n=1 Tax=Bacillus phage vB_BanS_Sophrita TaxID=2894790 RepID=A0AAE8YV96_9CAUD|nr:hypothetical protein PQE68_gp060 [Bacillus phage vB_BanS_Sophrita]UGO50651.1 hypothetical protein SOPHRITA_60 [Bacillus phage vB_BanS_Sophrita]